MFEKLLLKYKNLNFNDNIVRTKALVVFFHIFVSLVVLSLIIFEKDISFRNIDTLILIFFLFCSVFSLISLKFIKKYWIFGSYSIVSLAFLFEFFLFFELTKNAYGFFWYFAFPIFSISILGKNKGAVYALVLIILTTLIVRFNLFDVKVHFTRYFIVRFAIGYLLVFILSYIFEFFAQKTRNDYKFLFEKTEKYIEKIEKFNTQLKEAHNELLISQMKLQEANQNLDESIDYAKIIQSKLLPSDDMLEMTLNKYFLIFKPLSRVSGDFYYVNKLNDKLILSVGDCTGHGIPGALLSVLSVSLLHDVVNNTEISSPKNVLETMRLRIKLNFNFFSEKDMHGLDLAYCSIDLNTKELTYAGAFIPLFVLSENKVEMFDAVKNPIGYFYKENPFVQTKIKLKNNDKIYLSTDGFFDQIGTGKRRKLTKAKFGEIIQSIADLDLSEQSKFLLDYFDKWRGKQKQLDDITVLGFEWNENMANNYSIDLT